MYYAFDSIDLNTPTVSVQAYSTKSEIAEGMNLNTPTVSVQERILCK